METVIAQLTSISSEYFIAFNVGILIVLIVMKLIKSDDGDAIFVVVPLLFIVLFGVAVYSDNHYRNMKACKYANDLREDISKSQEVIAIDKEILYDVTNKSYLNEVEISLIKENYKPVRENKKYVYFQKCSNKS